MLTLFWIMSAYNIAVLICVGNVSLHSDFVAEYDIGVCCEE